MKLNYGVALILTGMLSGVVLADQAQPLTAGGEFYIDPGIALTGAGANGYKNSFSLDAGYLKTIHQIASIGWEVGYLFGSKFENDTVSADAKLKIFHLAPEIKVGPTLTVAGYNINPFIIGGGGFYWSHQNSGTLTFANGATTGFSAHDNYNGGWNIGAGAALSLPGNWSVGFDLRHHEIVNKHTADFTWFTPAFRFALLFT